MSKLRSFLTVSLVILGVLVVRVFLYPMTGGDQKYSEAHRESLLQTKDGWMLEFDIVNYEDQDRRYIIDMVVDAKAYQESCLINPGRLFTYIHQIHSAGLTEGVVLVRITKEGNDVPIKQRTYYLKKPALSFR